MPYSQEEIRIEFRPPAPSKLFTPGVTALADHVFSTGGMIRFARETGTRRIVVATEIGILHRLQRENPDKVFIPASEAPICPNMKITSLESVRDSLRSGEVGITVDSDVRRLAACPNVSCKVSGMVTEADWSQWRPSDFWPYLDVVLEAFGPSRIMFGSDWPVCTLVGAYADVAGILSSYVERLSPEEQADIWGRTARRFYGLE